MKAALLCLLLWAPLASAQARVKTLSVPSAAYWQRVDRCDLDILRMGRALLQASRAKKDGRPGAEKMGALARAFERDFKAFGRVSPEKIALKPLHAQLWRDFQVIEAGTQGMARGLREKNEKLYKYCYFRVGFTVRDARDIVVRMALIEKKSSADGLASAENDYAAKMRGYGQGPGQAAPGR